MLRIVQLLIGSLMLLERFWKYWMVIRFFQRRIPPVTAKVQLVSILQPILSGDPTLPACLEHNLRMQTSYPLEFLWLVDSDDREGQRICMRIMERHPKHKAQLIVLPPPPEGVNPKTFKLIAGVKIARGEIVCVLDDDTMLPDYGLEECLPYLDQPEVGLAFGLPYYTNFSNFWSQLVAYFVNSNSLMTYIPYTTLTEPFTINGMFYAVKREKLLKVGGFSGIEQTLADDFAIAQRFRSHGYLLAQTPLRHGISTHVRGPRPYFNLIQRWFIFPRESLLRHLGWREQGVLYGVAMLPTLFPPVLVLSFLLRPSRKKLEYMLLYFGINTGIFLHLNTRYLRKASPLREVWWVPAIQVIFPLQLLIALFSPQRIDWRGHIMKIEKGGKFRFERRRPQ